MILEPFRLQSKECENLSFLSFDANSPNSGDVKRMTDFLNSLPAERVILGAVYKNAYNGTKGNTQFSNAMVIY